MTIGGTHVLLKDGEMIGGPKALKDLHAKASVTHKKKDTATIFQETHTKSLTEKFGKAVADKVMAKVGGKNSRDAIGRELKKLGLIKSTVASPYADSNIVKNEGSKGNPDALRKWYDEGADDAIDWSAPGARTTCHEKASEYMDDDAAWGFCQERAKDTGYLKKVVAKEKSENLLVENLARFVLNESWFSVCPREKGKCLPKGGTPPTKQIITATTTLKQPQGGFADEKQAYAFGEATMKRKSKLTTDETKSLRGYVGLNFTAINGCLRKNTCSDVAKKSASNLRKAIAKSVTQQDITVTRGMNLPKEIDIEKMLGGKTFMEKGFVSTTLSSQVTKMFSGGTNDKKNAVVMTIKVPKGSNALQVKNNEQLAGESEVILPNLSAFKINRLTKDKDGVYHADVEYIGSMRSPSKKSNSTTNVIHITPLALNNRIDKFVAEHGDIEFIDNKKINRQLVKQITDNEHMCWGRPCSEVNVATRLSAKAGHKVKDAYGKFSDRYGKVGAIAMLGAMAATMPIPGNIFAVIGAAEGIRATAKLGAKVLGK